MKRFKSAIPPPHPDAPPVWKERQTSFLGFVPQQSSCLQSSHSARLQTATWEQATCADARSSSSVTSSETRPTWTLGAPSIEDSKLSFCEQVVHIATKNDHKPILQEYVNQALLPTRVQIKHLDLVRAVEVNSISIAQVMQQVLSNTASAPLQHRLKEAILASQCLESVVMPSGHGWRRKLHEQSSTGKARERASWFAGILRSVDDGGLNHNNDLLQECYAILNVNTCADPPRRRVVNTSRKPETNREWEQLEREVIAAQRARRKEWRKIATSWVQSFGHSQAHEECMGTAAHGKNFREGEESGYDASDDESSASSSASSASCSPEERSDEEVEASDECRRHNYNWILFPGEDGY